MTIELIFPPNSMKQSLITLLEQMNQPCRYTFEIDGTEAQLEWLKDVGQGSVRFIYLRPGLQISVEDHQMKENLIMQSQHFQSDPLKLYFLISGRVNGFVGQPTFPFALESGQNCLTTCGGDHTQTTYYAHQTYLAITILMDSSFFCKFLECDSGSLPQPLIRLLESCSAEAFFHKDSTVPEMQIALYQILHCPYYGLTKQIYVESKTMELIGLKFAQIGKEMYAPPKNTTLKPQDIERIHNAKDILLHNIEYPLSLHELAKQAGTNDYKLKIGFRQVFGTTVFGYLRRHRMELARQLFLETQMNVSEVARTVGYASLSQFSTAFKHHFGIAPKSYKNSL